VWLVFGSSAGVFGIAELGFGLLETPFDRLHELLCPDEFRSQYGKTGGNGYQARSGQYQECDSNQYYGYSGKGNPSFADDRVSHDASK